MSKQKREKALKPARQTATTESANTAPYFHRQVELRIPLTPKQRRNLKAILAYFPEDASTLAAFQLKRAKDILSEISEPSEWVLTAYLQENGMTPPERYEAFAHFHALGWVRDAHLEKARREALAWKSRALLVPGAKDALESDILAFLEKSRFPEMEKARLFLQGVA